MPPQPPNRGVYETFEILVAILPWHRGVTMLVILTICPRCSNDPVENIYVGNQLERDKGLTFSAHKYSSKLLSGSATEVIRQKESQPTSKRVSRLHTDGSWPWTGPYYKYSPGLKI